MDTDRPSIWEKLQWKKHGGKMEKVTLRDRFEQGFESSERIGNANV